MADRSYLDHVGYVLFPRRPDDLTNSTICPACFAPLTGTVCATCALDLSHPAAAELAAASATAAADIERRLEIIGRIRFETAAAVPVPAAAPAAVAPPATVAPIPAPDAAPRRHFGVQVILLIVGVSLLSIGAIFFLVYAFITFGLVWRSVIIAAVTVAAFAGASLLRWRKLGATAEAIACLAVVFVYLDAFAVRANDLFGAGDSDGLLYWGVTLLVSSAVFIVWNRLSQLRVPSIVGFAAFAPGLALIVAGLTEPLDTAERVFGGFLAAGVGGLVHALAGPKRAERIIPLVTGTVGLVAAGITSLLLDPASDWAPAIGLGIVALVGLAHVIVLLAWGGPRAFGHVFAGIGALAASTAVLVSALRIDELSFTLIAPVAAATAIALVLELVASRTKQRFAWTALWTAASVGALSLLPAVVTAIGTALRPAYLNTPRVWSVAADHALEVVQREYAAVIAIAVVGALVAVAWAIGRVLPARRLIPLWTLAAVAILAVPLLGVLWAAIAGWLALAVVGVTLLIRFRSAGVGVRALLSTATVAALGLAYAGSWASGDTWHVASIAAIVIVLVARGAFAAPAAKGAFLAVAVVLALVAAGAAGSRLNQLYAGGDARGLETVHAVALAAIVLLALAAVVRGRLVTALDTGIVFWLAAPTILITAIASWMFASGGDHERLALPDPAVSLGLGSGLLVALLLWVLLPRTAAFPGQRIAASIAVAPAAAWVADSLTRQFRLDDFVTTIAPIAAALIVAAISLAVARTPRWPWDVGIAIVAIPAVLAAASFRADATWLVLLLAGVAALFVAVSREGLFVPGSARKHIGWLALALAAAGLWWRLADDQITTLEAYVLPVAGVLLIVALLAWRAKSTASAPLIALGGLLVAILPIAVDSTDGSLPRSLVIGGVSAVLLLLGSFAPDFPALRPYLDAVAVAGALGTVIAGLGRPFQLSLARATEDLSIDAWVGGTLIVLLLAAVGQARRTQSSVRAIVSQVIVGIALAGLVLIELSVLEPGDRGAFRALAVIGVLALVYATAVLANRAPFTAVIGWIAISLAAVVAIVAIARDIVDPIEWATMPIAAALLAVGVVRMRSATAGSWAWLAPGLLVLLVPSLIATFVDQPVWRLVALGVLCIATILVGAIGRLQAPLIVGTALVLVHAIRTFAPQLRAVYEATEWWVWAVIGGAIVLFVALTFEKRVRDLKSVGTTIGSLR